MKKATEKDIDALLTLFRESTWQEMRLRYGATELHVSKDDDMLLVDAGNASEGRATPTDTVEEGAPVEAVSPHEAGALIRAPSVGTFYRSPQPGAEPFVNAGDAVSPDTEVGLMEVMKLFTAVRAGLSGTVQAVLVEDGVLVERDQPLFRVI